MFRAERTDAHGRRYAITQEHRTLTTVTLGGRRSDGRFELGGASYRIRSRPFGRAYDLLADDLSVVATADGVRRRLWTVQTAGQAHRFRRDSVLSRNDSLLDTTGRSIGTLTRTGPWRAGAVADLPAMDPRVQIFAIAVVLQRRRRRRIATAAVVGAARG